MRGGGGHVKEYSFMLVEASWKLRLSLPGHEKASCNLSLVLNGSSRPTDTLKERRERNSFNSAEATCVFIRSETTEYERLLWEKRVLFSDILGDLPKSWLNTRTLRHSQKFPGSESHIGSVLLTSTNFCISVGKQEGRCQEFIPVSLVLPWMKHWVQLWPRGITKGLSCDLDSSHKSPPNSENSEGTGPGMSLEGEHSFH